MFGFSKLIRRLLGRSERGFRGNIHEPYVPNGAFRSERRKQIIRSRILDGIQRRLSKESQRELRHSM